MEPEKRRHLRTGLLSAVFAAASLCAVHQAAQAGPVTEAGVYFVDTASMVSLGPKYNTTLFVNIPVVGYSTLWKLLGGRVEGYIAVPELYLGVKNAASTIRRCWSARPGIWAMAQALLSSRRRSTRLRRSSERSIRPITEA